MIDPNDPFGIRNSGNTSTGSIAAPDLGPLNRGFLRAGPQPKFSGFGSEASGTPLPSPQTLFKAPQDPNSPVPGVIKQEYDAPYRGLKNQRTPFLFSTVQGDVQFSFWINPSECSWRIPLRTTIEQIQGGAVHHEWDSTGVGIQNPQKFDQPIINFTFQSGNVAPQSWLDVSQLTFVGPPVTPPQVIPPGLANFYDFLALLNQPNITSDRTETRTNVTTGEVTQERVRGGDANYVIIQYHSLMMPLMVLQGFFTQEGVQWTDNSENPNGISTWGASFVVFSSTPSLFDRGALRDVYSSLFSSTGRGF